MNIKADEEDILKSTTTETTNLALVNAIIKKHFANEIDNMKLTDFRTLKGEKKKAFIRDMNKTEKLITQGYNSTMEFISFSLQVIK